MAKNKLKLLTYIVFLILFSACNDETSTIGGSLVVDESEVVTVSDFTLTGVSVDNSAVETRNLVQMLGRIDASGYGSMSAEFVTQLMPAAQLGEGMTIDNVDSIKIQFYISNGAYVGDSLVPMGLEVYKLNRQLPSNINSKFNVEGYYNENDLLASKIYTCNALGASDSVQNLKYRMIDVKLEPQAAKSLATELITLYETNPDAFLFPSVFAKEFPGIYVRNSYGNGRIVEIAQTMMSVYYHTTTTNDDGEEVVKRYSGNYFSVTPEIILNNILTYNMSEELEGIIAEGEPIIVAPIGRDVEISFPIEDVINYYNTHSGSLAVVNTLSLSIPVEAVENDYGIEPPENLLLILKNKKESFFKNNELADNVTSFYASYNSTNKCYTFGGLRNYMIEMLNKSNISSEDYTFVLTPVTIVTETNVSNSYYGTSAEYISSIDQYIGGPSMAKLNLEEAEIQLTFSKQTLN